MYDGGWRRVALDYGLIGYHMGTMNDYPEAQCVINDSHLGYAAYGACGIGENVGSLEYASLLALSHAYKAAASCRIPDINGVMH